MTSFGDIWRQSRDRLEREQRDIDVQEGRVQALLAAVNDAGLPLTRGELEDILDAGYESEGAVQDRRAEARILETLIGALARR